MVSQEGFFSTVGSAVTVAPVSLWKKRFLIDFAMCWCRRRWDFPHRWGTRIWPTRYLPRSPLHANAAEAVAHAAIVAGAMRAGQVVPKAALAARSKGGHFSSHNRRRLGQPDTPFEGPEILAPICMLFKFPDVEKGGEKELLKLLERSEYALTASVWARDGQRAQRVANKLEGGSVWVNSWLERNVGVPSGGYNQSGAGGQLGGKEGLALFSAAKTTTFAI